MVRGSYIKHREIDKIQLVLAFGKKMCDAPNFGGHFFFIQEFNVQLFYIPKYMKLYCSNIFYKNVSQGHNPTFFILTALKERLLLVYLKGGVP